MLVSMAEELPVPLEQWFDLSQPITARMLEAAAEQRAFVVLKDAAQPTGSRCFKPGAKLRAAVKAHNQACARQELEALVRRQPAGIPYDVAQRFLRARSHVKREASQVLHDPDAPWILRHSGRCLWLLPREDAPELPTAERR
jgi:hypothetical protein